MYNRSKYTMAEINLLAKYPQVKRNFTKRAEEKTVEVRRIARKFGKAFFDGERKYGYGGFYYHPRFWTGVVVDIIKYYRLTNKSSILDVGCAKGFMLYDFQKALPGAKLKGVDISTYAIDNALTDVKPFLTVGNAKELDYPDKSFDLVISINTVHNLPLNECKQAIREIVRVSRENAFITIDAYRHTREKDRLERWNLTAKTYMSVDAWEKLFKEVGYTGDYWWFI